MILEERIKDLLKDFRPKSQDIDLYNPNVQEKCFRYFTINKDGVRVKLFLFSTKIELEIKINTSLLFAVNMPDKVCLANKPLEKQILGHTVYTNHSNDNMIVNFVKTIEHDIEDWNLKTNEGFFVYGNSLQLFIDHQRELIPEIDSLIKIKSKIEKEPVPKSDVDASKLPVALQVLVPFLKEWALSDDFDRNEKINQASQSELINVINIVNPKMAAINNYLNSFKNSPLPYEAILIGNLAELVTEVMLLK